MTGTVSKDCYCSDVAGGCDCVVCKVCGESWTANADGLCRDCSVDMLIANWTCCPCGFRLYNPKIVLVQPHAETCPHEETGAYDPVEPSQEPAPLQAAYAAGYRTGFTDGLRIRGE